MDFVIEKISEDFDSEMKKADKLAWEAYLALSCQAREYVREKYFDFYIISASLKRTKSRISNLY